MEKNVISTDKAFGAFGPYSQGVKIGNLLFLSGQLPIDPRTGKIVSEDIKEQTRQALENMKAVIDAAFFTMENVLKVTLFIKDMNQFAEINEVYKTYFSSSYPARTCVEVSRIPKDCSLEIECIASL